MSLHEKIEGDLKDAMTARDAARTGTLRMLKSALKYSAIEKKTDVLADADIYTVIGKQIKQRRESIDQFEKAGRKDLASKEIQEMKILEAYLPKQLDDAEVDAAVRAAIQETGAASKKDFGKVMKLLTERLAGRADSKRISEAVSKILV